MSHKKTKAQKQSERLMLALTLEEKAALQKHANSMATKLGVAVSLSAACRALLFTALRMVTVKP